MRSPRTSHRGIRTRPFAQQRCGAAALEMALILPLLVTIVLGSIDFGRFAYEYIGVTNAARAGAAVGSFNSVTTATLPAWEEAIRAAVRDDMMEQTGYEEERLTIPSPTIIDDADGLRRVRVEVHYRFNTIVAWPFLPNELMLTRAVEMRIIR